MSTKQGRFYESRYLQTISYGYDAANRRTASIDPLGRITSFVHDDGNRAATPMMPTAISSSATAPALSPATPATSRTG